MCGINGITTNDPARVDRMNQAIIHRGPDGSRIWEGNGITLGHNRLAIIDLSDLAIQPMAGIDGRYEIVFNGEIYNYRELRAQLASKYTFKTESDTEVLITAYHEWGEAMFARLRGMFAFGLWDNREKTLTLVRDHMGIKPLYYTQKEGVLAFSSEIPGLLQGIENRVLNRRRVGMYLSMEYVPGPKTLIEGVYKLQPGHLLVYARGAYTVRSYLDALPKKRVVTEEEIYRTIDEGVHRQMVSDRPIGAYLSGGFDSSIVVHHMAKHSPHTKTYSVDFEAVRGEEEDSVKFNADAALAKQTAAFYGTDHKTLTIGLQDVRENMERVLSSMNEPVANSTAITQFLLSDFVRKDGVIVVLGGDGGDELFAGYTRHRLAMGAYMYQQLPHFLQRLGGSLSARVGKLSTPFYTPLHRTLMIKDEKKIAPFLTSGLSINHEVETYFNALYEDPQFNGVHPLDVFMNVDRRTWLADECFVRSDYTSMAHGIELRVPLLDLDIIKLADQLSIWKKVLPHEGKRIIRSTYKPYLPAHLYNQPKRGWLSPAAKWFRDPEISSFAREVFSSEYYSGLDGLFNWESVQSMLNTHIEKRGYYLYPLWNILVLQVWARKHNIFT